MLHTIIDPEWIWNQGTEIQQKKEIEYEGIRLEVIPVDEKTVVVDRVISTDPKDFMNPGLQPGSQLEYILKSQG